MKRHGYSSPDSTEFSYVECDMLHVRGQFNDQHVPATVIACVSDRPEQDRIGYSFARDRPQGTGSF